MLGVNWGSIKQDHVVCHTLKVNCFMGYLEEPPFSFYELEKMG